MSAKPLKKAAALLAATACLLVGAGCGSNPPCDTDLAAVDAARSTAKAADAKLEEAKRQQSDLQKQLDAEKKRKADLEARKAELEKQIAAMQGS
jgi:hypothetical protein